MILLSITLLKKNDYLSWQLLDLHKDRIKLIGAILSAFVVVMAAFVTYIRFFLGRIFALRAEVEVLVSVHDTGKRKYLHAISVSIKNVGSNTIWEPEPIVSVHLHDKGKTTSKLDECSFINTTIAEDKKSLPKRVEPNETKHFFTTFKVNKRIPVVTYVANVSSKNSYWWNSVTISNNSQKCDIDDMH